MSDKMMLKIALRIDARLSRQYQNYLDNCEQDRAEGHRPHYCEHGMNQWVDWDAICGWCEDGITMSDPLRRRTIALDEAKESVADLRKLLDAMEFMRKQGIFFTEDQNRLLADRLAEAMEIPAPSYA